VLAAALRTGMGLLPRLPWCSDLQYIQPLSSISIEAARCEIPSPGGSQIVSLCGRKWAALFVSWIEPSIEHACDAPDAATQWLHRGYSFWPGMEADVRGLTDQHSRRP
jgi:hypothetical protein